MKLKATIEVEYEIDLDDYTFSKSGDKKELILEFERKAFLTMIDVISTNEPAVIVDIVEV